MSREVNLLADIHNDEAGAQSYQRFAEVQNPDAVMIEATYADGSDMADSIQDYRTMADVHEAFGADVSQDKYQDPTVSEIPLYSLERRDFAKLVEPVRKYVDENYPDDADMDEAPIEQQRAMHAIRDVANTIQGDKSTLSLRLTDSAQFMGADVMGIEMEEDRSRMFEYGAREIDDLPNNPQQVEEVFNKIARGDQMEAQLANISGQVVGRDYVEGSSQLLEEYNPMREQNMAEFVETTMQDNGYESAVVVIGANHIEGVHSELPDEWEVTDFDLTGETSEWSVGELDGGALSAKNKKRQEQIDDNSLF